MSNRKAFTWVEMLVVIVVICGVIAVLLPALRAAPAGSNLMRNSANLRGIDQAMVIFGNTNNDYLPGLSANGDILTSGVQSFVNNQTGASFHARLWVLLNGQYIGGDLIVGPQDSLRKWVTGQNCTSANTSYAGLQIGDAANAVTTEHNGGRAGEWRNNANSQAIMFSDRLWVTSDNADASVQSVWTSRKGDWKGNLVWGDNHAEFQPSHKGFITHYAPYSSTGALPGVTNSNDNLFVTRASVGVTEGSGASDSNAMMIYF